MNKIFLLSLFYFSATVAGAADCFDRAAAWQGVDVTKLRSIAFAENNRCDTTVMTNTNKSLDFGCMQINSIHLKELSKHNIDRSDLLEKDQCKNIFIGAWHYRKKVVKYGDTWHAVGAYHSETPHLRDAYSARVKRIWERKFNTPYSNRTSKIASSQ